MLTRRIFLKSLVGLSVSLIGFAGLKLIRYESTSPPKVSDSTQASVPVNNKIKNSSTFLITPTYDQSGQGMHPSVIDFKAEYNLESWGGFRYWMAFTPYPNFNSADENPCILVSNNGLAWSNPPNLINPVEPRPTGPIDTDFNSDPELVFDAEQNQLFLYWREYYKGEYEKIWVKKFDSQLVSSLKSLCFIKVSPWKSKHGLSMSPTIWRKSANQWYMWTVNARGLMHLYTSQDGITWSEGQSCTTPWKTWNGGYLPWHVAAKPNYREQKIEFFICGWPKDSGIFHCKLFYAEAPMEQPLNLSMPLTRPILEPDAYAQWDNGFIYRSSFVIDQNENFSQRYRVWYSACSKEKVWHIGYTEGKLPTNLQSSSSLTVTSQVYEGKSAGAANVP